MTWTYKVTNTGNTNFAKADIAIVDDNGTSANTADDMSIANGKIIYQSGDDGDNVLEAGESWLYKATGTVQSLGGLGTAATIDFSGSSATDGTDGNTRSYTAGGVTVDANAWSRTKGTDTWQKAWLGSYGGGLGVTDSSESGSGDTHTVDNNGRDNYVVFQFSQNVVVDRAFLGYVVGDSDMTVYVGSSTAPITSMSNAVLSGMSLKEFNDTGSASTRWADFNAGNVQGNVLILAARDDGHSADYFKIEQLVFQAVEAGGVYANKATVTAGGLSDSDLSHYSVQAPVLKASIGNLVWCDTDGDGIQDTGELGVAGVTVRLLSTAGTVVVSTTTDTNGFYRFGNLNPGDYKIQVVKPTGYQSFTKANQGSDDTVDSDVDASGMTAVTTLVAGENDISWDAGFAPNVKNLSFNFNGSTASDGTDGNTRSYTVDGVTVNASAWSRTQGTTQTWAKAWLGAYSGGHGVTDSGEGSGSGNTHTMDNNGRDNYIVYQFSSAVTVDKIGLGYVYNDSDISVWIGNSTAPITAMSNAVLTSMGFTEVNTGGSSARTADINAGGVSGNVLIVAAKNGETNDYVKVQDLQVVARDSFVTPLVVDLDGDGVQTVALADARGSFDLFGNGRAVQSGWASAGDGFLAVDGDGNGKIDSISELFGGSKQGDGYAKLAGFDSNGDGVVDASDAGYIDLSVWRDANGNHQTDAGELMSLAEAGVASLDLDYSADAFMDANGNLHLEQGSATMSDGRLVDMTDVYFAVAANDAAGLVGQATVDPALLFA
ncbi:SdrD B-like domain-containing protein [Accumulibacter sp.]|uniref:SdrD B-like domain-containing protein n=1 Tax=Accumulibacter sp. TaxID=2053492 RepID=UPI001A3BBCFB|nr:SdrD B-like domain-containing protein [Accumulibacter sp.]MBL8375444.1 carboxypeptidase regulatory-like domain-containing protein [Accumulibacter sp.]